MRRYCEEIVTNGDSYVGDDDENVYSYSRIWMGIYILIYQS